MWLAVGFVAGVLFLIGNFSMVTTVVFGFICFGLVFMGMMCVLPSTVGHNSSIGEKRSLETPQFTRYPKYLVKRLRGFKPAFISSNGVEVHKPKYQ